MTHRAEWLAVSIGVYAMVLEAATGALLVFQHMQLRDYFGAASDAQFMVAPLPIEVAVIGPLLAFIAWRHRTLLLRFAAVAVAVFGVVNTLLWLVGFLAWFLVECSGSFCGY